MKTRRNHRKTTTGRRRRHVKHRVQTRINHRKKTVSSGRRYKFFKRGGEPPIDRMIQVLVDGVENTVKARLKEMEILSHDTTFKLGVERISSKPSKVITNTPIVFKIDGEQINFVIVEPILGTSQQSVYIYMYDTNNTEYLYGSVMVTIGTENMGSYNKYIATIIFNAINSKPDFEKYKQK